MKSNPCESCGACCAFFCVSFSCKETSDNAIDVDWTVPVDMTSYLNESKRFMQGTENPNPRCIALEGNVGEKVKCNIYANRPSACREFNMSWENNTGNFLCDKSREFYGLQSFSQY
jgi:uncharacterized protein